MPRVVSFIVLVAILLLMGAVFFQVMAQYVVPLFLASVLVVIFKPLHERIRRRMPNWPRMAALSTTTLILFVALLPTAWLGWNAYLECGHVFDNYLSTEAKRDELQKVLLQRIQPTLKLLNRFTGQGASPAAPAIAGKQAPAASQPATAPPTVAASNPNAPAGAGQAPSATPAADNASAPGLSQDLGNRIGKFVGGTLLTTVQALGRMALGLAIMQLAIYYFFLDGPSMISTIMRMSPLDDVYERELLDKFATVSRAVVVASLASAVAQGLLSGIGYYFALNSGAPIFLLTMVTMLMGIVPFVGAAAVWVPTALWIYMFQTVDVGGVQTQGDAYSAIGLAVYGACVVSAVDNFIKPMVLHGQSNLHPLLALISVLGGVEVLGPTGILVGPMLVAFCQALVNMVNKELVRLGDAELESLQSRGEAGGDQSLIGEMTAALTRAEDPKPAKPKSPPAKRRRRK